jgi:hypothetical protein
MNITTYMYSLYNDIIQKDCNLIELIHKQQSRDKLLLVKMKKYNIPKFPMSQHKAEETMQFFKNITARKHLLNIIFLYRNDENQIQYCNVISKGMLFRFNSERDAFDFITNEVNSLYNVSSLTVTSTKINQRIVK